MAGGRTDAAAPSQAHPDLLIVFGEVPELGKGLEEIASTHGPQAAFRLRRLLLDLSIEHAQGADVEKWFRYPAGTTRPELASSWTVAPHEGRDIGVMVDVAMAEGFARGFGHIVAFYADCPSLVQEFIEGAYEDLHDGADLVLGPTNRGGLYLVGAGPKAKGIFSLFPWRTPTLFEEAQHEAEEHGLLVAVLPRKDAVETLEDWKRVAAEGWVPGPPPVSGGSGRPEG